MQAKDSVSSFRLPRPKRLQSKANESVGTQQLLKRVIPLTDDPSLHESKFPSNSRTTASYPNGVLV